MINTILPTAYVDLDDKGLHVLFYRHSTELTDWFTYIEWHERNRLHKRSQETTKYSLPFPDVDKLYGKHHGLLGKSLGFYDELLLELIVSHIDQNTARLDLIQRNLDTRFKGIGAKAYSGLVDFLREDYDFLIGEPLPGLEEYWMERGQVPAYQLQMNMPDTVYVHDLRYQ